MNIVMTSEDIKVSLSTSKFCDQSHGMTAEQHKAFVDFNIPICVAENILQLGGINIEQIELLFSQACLKMAKKIHVSDHYFFCGENPNDELTGLVIFRPVNLNEFETEFFKQWEKTKTCMFEFQALTFERKDIFTIKGYWRYDRWLVLDFLPSSRLHIAKKENT